MGNVQNSESDMTKTHYGIEYMQQLSHFAQLIVVNMKWGNL